MPTTMTRGSVAAPASPGGKRPARLSRRAVTALSLLTFAILWEVAGRWWLDPIYFASLSDSLGGLVEMLGDGTLVRALGESLALFTTGFAIGAALGLLVGLVVGRIETLAIAVEDYITILYITPPIVVVPFVLSIIGYGFWPKVLVVITFVFFPVCILTVEGVRSTSNRLLEVAHAFGASELGTWKDVVIPSTLPYAMSGIRQAIARGLVGVIAAEFLLDASGVGQLLNSFSRQYRMDKLLATVLVVVIIALVSMALGRKLEERYASWRR
jgi:ABC-type nitrate/sulfonate/bicarbonate transport system permease component